MNRREFFEKAKKVVRAEDLSKIKSAYWLSKAAHRLQKRDSGERYFEHCRRTAILFMDYCNSTSDKIRMANGVIIALLHDCVEDCFVPLDLVNSAFGDYVRIGIEEISKVFVSENNAGFIIKRRKNDADYYRGIDESVLAVYVKLCDRLDNIIDLKGWTKKRVRQYVAETEKY